MLKSTLYALCIFFSGMIITGCSSSYIITVWKNQHAFPGKYNKILIAGIVNNTDTAFRAELENHFKESLEAMGYPAVSSLAEFGPAGLKGFGQEDTYITLCNKGIDAVMTIALVDRSIESVSEPKSAYTDPVKYYYERIWHYKERQSRITASFYDTSKKYSWEMILFDLSTLQPHAIVQSKIYTNGIPESLSRAFWKDIVKKLNKDRYLKKREPVSDISAETPKAF